MSKNHENAIQELSKLLQNPTVQEYGKYEHVVIKEFKEKFSSKLDDLTVEDVRRFLDFKVNHHWTGIDRHKSAINESSLDAIKDLLRDDRPVSHRINEFTRKVKGIGKAVYSALLYLGYPEKYAVWNEISEWSLKFLGVWLEGIPYEKRANKKLEEGEIYEVMSEDLKKIAKELGCSLWTLDTILWVFQSENQNSVPKSLEVSKDYTKEELNKLFDPELKFYGRGTHHGGKWARGGLISLFGGKHYGVFGSGIADSIDLNKGEFIWLEQEKMQKNPNNRMLKKIRNNELNLLLFYKFDNNSNKYTYIGPIKYGGGSETLENKGNKKVRRLSFQIIESDEYLMKIARKIVEDPNSKIAEKIIVDGTDNEDILSPIRPEFRPSVVNARAFQGELRDGALEYYGRKCFICDIDNERLLRVSHIIPVNKSIDDAGKVKNTIILCVLHDVMFDRGLITLDSENNFNILVSKELKNSGSERLKGEIQLLENAKLKTDKIDNSESRKFLKYHKDHIFIK